MVGWIYGLLSPRTPVGDEMAQPGFVLVFTVETCIDNFVNSPPENLWVPVYRKRRPVNEIMIADKKDISHVIIA